jgi:hypothetical protein
MNGRQRLSFDEHVELAQRIKRIRQDLYWVSEKVEGVSDWRMRAGVEKIDGMFGQGYAKGHPELVVGFMRISFDYLAEDDGIAAAIRGMPDTSGVADALDRVSSSLDSAGDNIARAIDGLKLATIER